MLLITTSNGVFKFNYKDGEIKNILKPESSLGIFGIAKDKNNDIYVASREKLGFSFNSKLSSDVILYKINRDTLESTKYATLRKVYDVHQIAIWNDIVYLSDSTKDTVHTFSLTTKMLMGKIFIGDKRADTHHINALLVDGENLLLGLNNRGFFDSQVLYFPLNLTPLKKGNDIDALKVSEVNNISGFQHTHDLEICNGTLMVCASKEGLLIQAEGGRKLFQTEGFVRGIAENEYGIWLGVSQTAPRKERHSSTLDGQLLLLDKNKFTLKEKFTIPLAGQVFDILNVL